MSVQENRGFMETHFETAGCGMHIAVLLAGVGLIIRIHITAHPMSLKLNTFQSDCNNNKILVKETFYCFKIFTCFSVENPIKQLFGRFRLRLH